MQFENTFDVAAPIDEVYAALLDVERVAPCVPGAEVLEQTGDDAYKVGIKVKVGPMSMQYKGDVEVVEQDPSAHRAALRMKMREARGQGTANADVVMNLSEESGRTRGNIATEVQMSGRVASMGRGIIQDVSARIIDQFSENLAQMLGGGRAGAEPEAAAAPAAAPVPAGVTGEAPAPGGEPQSAAGNGSPSAAAAAEPPKPAPSQAPPPKPAEAELSATDLAGAVIAGRLQDPKVLAGVVAGAVAVGYLLGRR
jgi:uncharacterized protein